MRLATNLRAPCGWGDIILSFLKKDLTICQINADAVGRLYAAKIEVMSHFNEIR